MTEQQQHLQNLLNQRQEIVKQIEELQNKITGAKELGLKVQGAIEYLEQIGVKLEEEAEVKETTVVEDTADQLLEEAVEGL
jgi:prefoldin subunit 5